MLSRNTARRNRRHVETTADYLAEKQFQRRLSAFWHDVLDAAEGRPQPTAEQRHAEAQRRAEMFAAGEEIFLAGVPLDAVPANLRHAYDTARREWERGQRLHAAGYGDTFPAQAGRLTGAVRAGYDAAAMATQMAEAQRQAVPA